MIHRLAARARVPRHPLARLTSGPPLPAGSTLKSQSGSPELKAAPRSAGHGALSPVRSAASALRSLSARRTTHSAASNGAYANGSVEMFAVGTLPPVGPGRWAYLADPAHWQPERRKLHDALIDDSFRKASVFAECVERSGCDPTLFALRGNTAAGKTRLARSAVPALADALQESGGGSINPDAFKSRLRKVPGQARLTPANVHAESCVLADRLERQIATGKTASGKPASMLVDKRLGGAHEVARYIALSENTGRQVEMYDIDMPLERSLLGVLQRDPDGDDPRPPYAAVAAGYCAIRGNRLDVIDQFLAKPQIGTYHLMGTLATGEKAPVATVSNGELTIHDADQYAEIVALSDLPASDMGEQVIDDGTIRQLTHAMPAAIAETAREALQKYAGLSWSQALGIHCTLNGQD